jgi:hypothetical protein
MQPGGTGAGGGADLAGGMAATPDDASSVTLTPSAGPPAPPPAMGGSDAPPEEARATAGTDSGSPGAGMRRLRIGTPGSDSDLGSVVPVSRSTPEWKGGNAALVAEQAALQEHRKRVGSVRATFAVGVAARWRTGQKKAASVPEEQKEGSASPPGAHHRRERITDSLLLAPQPSKACSTPASAQGRRALGRMATMQMIDPLSFVWLGDPEQGQRPWRHGGTGDDEDEENEEDEGEGEEEAASHAPPPPPTAYDGDGGSACKHGDGDSACKHCGTPRTHCAHCNSPRSHCLHCYSPFLTPRSEGPAAHCAHCSPRADRGSDSEQPAAPPSPRPATPSLELPPPPRLAERRTPAPSLPQVGAEPIWAPVHHACGGGPGWGAAGPRSCMHVTSCGLHVTCMGAWVGHHGRWRACAGPSGRGTHARAHTHTHTHTRPYNRVRFG